MDHHQKSNPWGSPPKIKPLRCSRSRRECRLVHLTNSALMRLGLGWLGPYTKPLRFSSP